MLGSMYGPEQPRVCARQVCGMESILRLKLTLDDLRGLYGVEIDSRASAPATSAASADEKHNHPVTPMVRSCINRS